MKIDRKKFLVSAGLLFSMASGSPWAHAAGQDTKTVRSGDAAETDAASDVKHNPLDGTLLALDEGPAAEGGPAFEGAGPAFEGGGPAAEGGPAFEGGGPAFEGGPSFEGGGGPAAEGGPAFEGGPSFEGGGGPAAEGGPAFEGGPSFEGGGPAFEGGPSFEGGGPAFEGGPSFEGGGPSFEGGVTPTSDKKEPSHNFKKKRYTGNFSAQRITQGKVSVRFDKKGKGVSGVLKGVIGKQKFSIQLKGKRNKNVLTLENFGGKDKVSGRVTMNKKKGSGTFQGKIRGNAVKFRFDFAEAK